MEQKEIKKTLKNQGIFEWLENEKGIKAITISGCNFILFKNTRGEVECYYPIQVLLGGKMQYERVHNQLLSVLPELNQYLKQCDRDQLCINHKIEE